jgi:hypothetical protein
MNVLNIRSALRAGRIMAAYQSNPPSARIEPVDLVRSEASALHEPGDEPREVDPRKAEGVSTLAERMTHYSHWNGQCNA